MCVQFDGGSWRFFSFLPHTWSKCSNRRRHVFLFFACPTVVRQCCCRDNIYVGTDRPVYKRGFSGYPIGHGKNHSFAAFASICQEVFWGPRACGDQATFSTVWVGHHWQRYNRHVWSMLSSPVARIFQWFCFTMATSSLWVAKSSDSKQPAARSSLDLSTEIYTTLGGGFNLFLFSPLSGEMIQFD